MLEILAMFGWFDLGILIGPLWRKYVTRDDVHNTLLYGVPQSKQIPILDNQLNKYIGVELSWTQKKAHAKGLGLIRSVVNTRAFEIVTAKAIKDYWVLEPKQLDSEFEVL